MALRREQWAILIDEWEGRARRRMDEGQPERGTVEGGDGGDEEAARRDVQMEVGQGVPEGAGNGKQQGGAQKGYARGHLPEPAVASCTAGRGHN